MSNNLSGLPDINWGSWRPGELVPAARPVWREGMLPLSEQIYRDKINESEYYTFVEKLKKKFPTCKIENRDFTPLTPCSGSGMCAQLWSSSNGVNYYNLFAQTERRCTLEAGAYVPPEVILPRSIQNNINNLSYTEDPLMAMMEIDIDIKPINLDKLIEKGRVLGVEYQKKREEAEHLRIMKHEYGLSGFPKYRRGKYPHYEFVPNPKDEDIINALRNAFIVKEQEKINEEYSVGSLPSFATHNQLYTYQSKFAVRAQKFDQRMKRKMPKIEEILKQVKARLALNKSLAGIVPDARASISGSAAKSGMNRNGLSRLYASAPVGAPVSVVLPAGSLAAEVSALSSAANDPFAGLGGKRKRTHKTKRKSRKTRKN